MNLGPINSTSPSAGVAVPYLREPAVAAGGPAVVSTSGSLAATAATQAALLAKDASGETGVAQLDHAVDTINQFLKPVASSIQFSVDEESGRTLVKVIDTDTNTVLRQFPSKETLAMSSELSKLQGLLLREKA